MTSFELLGYASVTAIFAPIVYLLVVDTVSRVWN